MHFRFSAVKCFILFPLICLLMLLRLETFLSSPVPSFVISFYCIITNILTFIFVSLPLWERRDKAGHGTREFLASDWLAPLLFSRCLKQSFQNSFLRCFWNFCMWCSCDVSKAMHVFLSLAPLSVLSAAVFFLFGGLPYTDSQSQAGAVIGRITGRLHTTSSGSWHLGSTVRREDS